jgi:UrcA family protein
MFKMTTLKNAALFGAAAAATVIGNPAMAVNNTPMMVDVMKQTVSYDDLDLSNAVGQQKLHDRIASAVDHVCDVATTTTLEAKRYSDRCKLQSLAQAIPETERVIAAYKDNLRMVSNDQRAIVGN